jgi:hypothetical protein
MYVEAANSAIVGYQELDVRHYVRLRTLARWAFMAREMNPAIGCMATPL